MFGLFNAYYEHVPHFSKVINTMKQHKWKCELCIVQGMKLYRIHLYTFWTFSQLTS